MTTNSNLTYLLLAAIDGHETDLSAYTKPQIDDALRLLIDQGLAFGKPLKRVGDPVPHYTVRGLRLTALGESLLDSAGGE